MSTDPAEAQLPNAAALAVAVADYDPEAVAAVLTPLDRDGLCALAIILAAQVNLDGPIRVDPAPRFDAHTVGRSAVRRTAVLFGTSPVAVFSTSRVRSVVDARGCAMYACRLLGMTLTAIGAEFERDHTTVLHACTRVGEDPRLRGIATKVATDLGWSREGEAA